MKIFTGKVISTKMQKTATVDIVRVVIHPVYKKRYKINKKYHVHNEIGAKTGDTVRFKASKPYSKLKKWKLIEVVGKSKSKAKPEIKKEKSSTPKKEGGKKK